MIAFLATLPENSLQSILSHTSAATSIRCTMASKSLATAANAVARGRASCIGTDFSDEADTLPWEEGETRPFAVVFKKELTDILIRLDAKSSDWRNAADFLWFKLTEKDLNHEFVDGKAGIMVQYDMEVGSEVESLHYSIDGAQYWVGSEQNILAEKVQRPSRVHCQSGPPREMGKKHSFNRECDDGIGRR